jgi:hypothetical protein
MGVEGGSCPNKDIKWLQRPSPDTSEKPKKQGSRLVRQKKKGTLGHLFSRTTFHSRRRAAGHFSPSAPSSFILFIVLLTVNSRRLEPQINRDMIRRGRHRPFQLIEVQITPIQIDGRARPAGRPVTGCHGPRL